ncbi:MAG: hemolysin family protein [Acidobacteriota bacterium]|nr:hemolysin family protein [Acidobacteriota bacterium]
MILLAVLLLLLLLTLFTCIQTLYLEGMRLRTRDLPSLQYFKTNLEPRLNFRSEEGAFTFSLWKHICLVCFTVMALAQVIDGGYLTLPVLLESLAGSLLAMILCAYIIPQLLFRRTSGVWLGHLIPFYSAAALMMRPLVAALNFLHSLLEITAQEAERAEPATSAENIEALITAGTEEGLIQEDDRRLIQSVVEFGDKVVREVMTARPNLVSIASDETLEALHKLVVTEQYSRIPVYRSSIDDVIGFVHVRDMFEVPESDRLMRRVKELMRPIRFVPETKPVNDLMREMQQEGAHMVIVVDEYGNTAGLVTMEDLVEVILGEIRDEHEPDSDVVRDENGGYIVSGNFDIARIADILEFRPDEDIESTTIGGLVTEWLGKVPKAGESIGRDGMRVEVLASDEMRVEKVRLSPLHPKQEPEAVPGAETEHS